MPDSVIPQKPKKASPLLSAFSLLALAPLVPLLEKYNQSGPRYTSYPTAPMWTEDFNAEVFDGMTRQANVVANSPLSLYTHLPFCEERCLFCGCNVVITRQRDQAEKYLGYLFREIEEMAAVIPSDRPVVQYHWGGGTPTYLSCDQMERLFAFHKAHFTFHPDAEISIEVDPRVTDAEQLACLRALGFNRLSLGVQDFQPETQAAVHRHQSVAQTEALVNTARDLGFSGINFDLIYGLPHQTPVSFQKTVDEVLRLDPDRIALYSFAYVPWMSPHQQQIPETTLPVATMKFQIFYQTLCRLLEAGYVYIGMDHFAKPTDELCRAQENGSLHRNFMGYTTQAGCELYGMGVSAISALKGCYAQNVRKLSGYYEAIEQGGLATFRGCVLSEDDLLRREAINQILCQGSLSYKDFLKTHGVVATEYFSDALVALAPMADDGLVVLEAEGLYLTPLGRILSRNVAMAFDAYLQNPKAGMETPPLYSKTL